MVMLIDNFLATTVVATLIIVPVISFVVGRFEALPVDLVNAAIAILIFFVDRTVHFKQENHAGPGGAGDYFAFFFVVLISGVITVLCIGIYLTIKAERKILHLDAEKIGTPYIEIGYSLSLLLSIIFVTYSFYVTASIPIIFGDTEENISLFEVVSKMAGLLPSFTELVEIVISLYLVFLLIRYWQFADNLLRKWLHNPKTSQSEK
jgi:hypothetical protein